MKKVKSARKAAKQRNSHARSKQKRRALRLKNEQARVISKRHERKMRELAPKGQTIVGKAKEVAMYVGEIPNVRREISWPDTRARYPNQRQKRKKWRSNPHLRKAA